MLKFVISQLPHINSGAGRKVVSAEERDPNIQNTLAPFAKNPKV